MIRVTIELVPFGIESRKKVIKRMIIANDGTGTPRRGNYVYHYGRKEGELKNFPRKSYNVWKLIQRILNQER